MCHICGNQVKGDVWGRGGGQKGLWGGGSDSQHGTGVEGSLLPCTKATNPSKDLFVFLL